MVFPWFDLNKNVGLDRSGRSVGFISTDSRTYKSPWCRVMSKKRKKNTVVKQGWNQWILALDVRQFGLGRQGGKFPVGNFKENSGKFPGNVREMSGKFSGKFRKIFRLVSPPLIPPPKKTLQGQTSCFRDEIVGALAGRGRRRAAVEGRQTSYTPVAK